MLGAAYALHKGAHIRTDFFWEQFSPRTKGLIDSISYVVFFFPSFIDLCCHQLARGLLLLPDQRDLRPDAVAADPVAVQVRRAARLPAADDPGLLRAAEELLHGAHRHRARAQREGRGMTCGRVHRPGHARGAAGRDLHRRADLLHAAVPGLHLRLHRHGRTGLRPRLLPDHRHDEGGAAGGRAALHLHGLHHRAGGPDGAAVHGLPPAARAGARRALSGGHPDGDRVRHGDRHRRRGGDRARHHGLADHDQVGLRRQALGRHHHRRRHARHPHPAIGDADRDGAGARRVGGRPLRGRVRPGLPAGRHLHRLSDGPQHSSIRSSGRRCRWRSACTRSGDARARWSIGVRAAARPHHARRSGSILAGLATPTEAAGIGTRRRAAAGARLSQAHARRPAARAQLDHGDVEHGAAAGRHLQHLRRGVRAARHGQLDHGDAAVAASCRRC